MTPREVLLDAANYLMREGWTQKPSGDIDATGPTCAGIALHRVANDEDAEQAAVVLLRHLGLPIDRWGVDITQWNDEPENTVEDVVLAMKRAAVEA